MDCIQKILWETVTKFKIGRWCKLDIFLGFLSFLTLTLPCTFRVQNFQFLFSSTKMNFLLWSFKQKSIIQNEWIVAKKLGYNLLPPNVNVNSILMRLQPTGTIYAGNIGCEKVASVFYKGCALLVFRFFRWRWVNKLSWSRRICDNTIN